jgi:hypothetical protein
MPRRARRTFTPQFKAEVVLALLTGEQSAAERSGVKYHRRATEDCRFRPRPDAGDAP